MYSSGYSQVSKHSPQSQKRIQYRSKGKSCGYYMRIVFFFSSLIQSLIIVSLVLFLVYGKKQDSPSTARIQDLEESFSRLSIENVALRQQRTNLTNLLNATLTDKARNDWDLAKIIHYTNVSALMIQDLDRKMQQCNADLLMCRSSQRCPCDCSTRIIHGNNCGAIVEQLKAKNDLLESNFTQTVQTMRREMDRVTRERDFINLEAIRLRREKSTHEKELEFYRQKSKDDFSQSLKGVTNVSKAFLHKIESLFPVHLAFQLTCPKQQEHLEQIRTNCTSLSREVEDKLQRYLDSVGNQVMGIQIESTRLKAENWRLSEDYRWCIQNRTGVIQENKKNFDKLQQKHDQEKERLLVDKMKLLGDMQVLENTVKYKNKEVEHLNEKMRHLNMTCMSRMGSGGFSSVLRGTVNQPNSWGSPGGANSPSSSSTGVGQLGRTGSGGLGSSFGSSGTVFKQPASSATGASSSSITSLGSSSSSSSTGSLFNKPNSPGGGLSSFGSAGSSTSLSTSGSMFKQPASSATGASSSSFSSLGSSSSSSSTGSLFNKPSSPGGGLTSFGSAGSSTSLSTSGIGSAKPGLTSRGSLTTGSSSGSSSGSTGITNKSGSTSSGFSWFGLGNTNSGQSKPGSTTGRGTSIGSSSSSSGSVFGSGRTSGIGGGTVSVAQHLKDLQRIINPSAPEEKQDLSRMLG